MGFNEAKKKVLLALASGDFLNSSRKDVDEKNLLAIGEVAAGDVAAIIKSCNGTHHKRSAHHMNASIEVHVIKKNEWYIKFYFADPMTIFMSVHR